MADSVAEWLARFDGSGIQQPVDCFGADAQEGRRLGGSDLVCGVHGLLKPKDKKTNYRCLFLCRLRGYFGVTGY